MYTIMQRNVERLEKIMIKLVNNDIKTISKTDLQNIIMMQCQISKQDTIKWYLQVCINYKWVRQKPKVRNKDSYFDITYTHDKGELF